MNFCLKNKTIVSQLLCVYLYAYKFFVINLLVGKQHIIISKSKGFNSNSPSFTFSVNSVKGELMPSFQSSMLAASLSNVSC